MKFTLSWLKTHLETDAPLVEIAETLTAIGLEVESVLDRTAAFAPFTVAHVIEAGPHPNADKLKLCLVDTGEERVEVICGAPNARTGMKGVFAPVGTTIPGTGVKLKRAKIRGVESCGMLCSEREMGLSDEHEGIMELPQDAPLGAPFAAVMGLDDPLIEIAITPNRADCLGVRGIARDLAAAGIGRLKPRQIAPVPGVFPSPVGIHLRFPEEARDACPLFLGRYIRGVRNGESPRWLQERLSAVGLRPISALVDITNFLTLDENRPAHVFDADKIAGDLWVALGQGGTQFGALDGKTYEIDDEMTAIGDDTGMLSLAGVMGGEASGCTAETVNVFIEIALFDPRRTAATGRKLAVESDARYRFERGVDPAFAEPGMERATRLVLDLCGGEASDVVVAGAAPPLPRPIAFRPSRVEALGGVAGAGGRAQAVLEALGFACTPEGDDAMTVTPPTWRGDAEGEADLVEEVLRIEGFDRIPAVSLPRPEGEGARPPETLLSRTGAVRRTLAARGMLEAVTWSFLPRRQAALFGGGAESLRLENPISADLDYMRPSILPNLAAAAKRNADRGMADAALFEIGPCYEGPGEDGQRLAVAALRAGRTVPRNWLGPARAVDAFDAKADALAALEAAGAPADRLRTEVTAPGWYHPGRAGTLALGSTALAFFGELHPTVLKALDAEGPMAGFEVLLDALPARKAKASRARPALRASDYPAVERDFAFVLDAAVPAAEVERAVRNADKTLIANVGIFDLYDGEGVEPGKKSLAVAVRLEPQDRTLTDPEIEAVAGRVVANVEKTVGGTLRR